MPRAFARAKSTKGAGENYFISMTDVLVGLLFVFIILIVFLAILVAKENQELQATVIELQALQNGGPEVRDRGELVTGLKDILVEDGHQGLLPLAEEGVLSILGQGVFTPLQYEVEVGSYGEELFLTIAKRLNEGIECWAYRDEVEIDNLRNRNELSGKKTYHDSAIDLEDGRRLVIVGEDCVVSAKSTIQTIMIEGHTDDDPIRGTGNDIQDNLELSAQRALSVFRLMTESTPLLMQYYNREGEKVLSFSGYGEDRPRRLNDTPANKNMNRRIDLRFMMDGPNIPPEINELEQTIQMPVDGI